MQTEEDLKAIRLWSEFMDSGCSQLIEQHVETLFGGQTFQASTHIPLEFSANDAFGCVECEKPQQCAGKKTHIKLHTMKFIVKLYLPFYSTDSVLQSLNYKACTTESKAPKDDEGALISSDDQWTLLKF